MPLDIYQLHVLRDFRVKEQLYGLKFITLSTGAGYFSPYDAYKKITYTETETFFSGAVLFSPYPKKSDSAGGFYNVSDLVIVASIDNKNIAQSKDVKVSYDGINYRVDKCVSCPDTNEIVINATRLE